MELNGYMDITKRDYDEARKLWLIHNVWVDPHAGNEVVYKLRALDVTFAYDLGYRQALLALRKEFNVRLKRFTDTRDRRYGERLYSLGKLELVAKQTRGDWSRHLSLPCESYICVKRAIVEGNEILSVTNISDHAVVESNIIYSFINLIRHRIEEKLEHSYQSQGYGRIHILVLEMDRYMQVTDGDYDEYRKTLLIHSMEVDPSAGDENIYSLSTLDAIFVYDLGYRRALLSLRKVFDEGISRLAAEVGQNAFEAQLHALNIVELNAFDSFVDLIRHRINENIEISYQTEGYESHDIRWERKRNCQNSGDW